MEIDAKLNVTKQVGIAVPPYSLKNRLVVGIASSAMFDLTDSDSVFVAEGEERYRDYQTANLEVPLEKGVAFSFIKRLLSLNDLSPGSSDPLVEVILFSRNDPETGLRVMRSISHHKLPMTRAIFMAGKSPHMFIDVLNVSLFLSANERDVKEALASGFPAGLVLASTIVDDDDDLDLRIAFDFDGVLADDSSEQVMQRGGLDAFHDHESKNFASPLDAGPLKRFLAEVKKLQGIEAAEKLGSPGYRARIHVSLVTARNAPSHERAINTLKHWGLMVNDAFFLGGIEKGPVLGVLRPHIFFDDQPANLLSSSPMVPSVHIPLGVVNEPKP